MQGHNCTIDCAWGCIAEDELLRRLEREFDESAGLMEES